MMKVMLDLETLDTGPNSTIISIGAVQFNPELDPATRSEFYVAILPDQRAWGRTINGETVAWWAKQTESARFVLRDPDAVGLPEALNRFCGWFGYDKTVEVWGNGADFDNVILGSALEGCLMRKPWSHSMNRCYRTLKNLGIPLGAGEGLERTGVHHNALDDAKYQAHYATAWLRRLK
jgi:exodeoxyribonuclease VIII